METSVFNFLKVKEKKDMEFRKEFKKVMEFLKDRFPNGEQTFFSRNISGDEMRNIYEEDGISIDHCPYWGYIEIFGLTREEQEELEFHTDYCSMPSRDWG